MRKHLWIAVTVLGGLIVVGSIFITIWQSSLARAAQHWASTAGTITQNHVYHNSNGRRSSTYEPMARYTYQVGDTAYEGSRIWLVETPEWDTQQEARAILDRFYPVGQPVEVRYDPAAPYSSALVLQQPDFGKWLLIGGLGLLMLFGGITFRGQMSRRG